MRDSWIDFLDKIVVTTGALLVLSLAIAGAMLLVAVAVVSAVSAALSANPRSSAPRRYRVPRQGSTPA